jgi:ElaA protein
MPEPVIAVCRFADLDASTLYGILRLRVDVFVVEQRCPYPELDGRDIEESTLHAVARDDAEVVAYLRLVADPDGTRRIGRVCVAAGRRGEGLAQRLMREALSACNGEPVVLHAQTYLRRWYETLGFVVAGEEFVEDGIPHVLMRRDP